MPEIPPPTEDLDAILALAQRLFEDPDDFSRSDVHKLARIAVDFVALSKAQATLQKQHEALSQTSALHRALATLQKEYVELSESKTQVIDRCSALLNENRRLHRIVFHPNQARSLAHALQIWAREVEAQAFARECGLTDCHETEGEEKK